MSKVIPMATAKQTVFIVHRNGCYFGTYSSLEKAQEACKTNALEWRWEGKGLRTYQTEYRITESEVA